MKPVDLKKELLAFAGHSGINLQVAAPSVGVSTMSRFFCECHVDRCTNTTDGDMLLYQWETYSWGAAAHFELDITRCTGNWAT
jgi:hypothetical protein